MLMLTDVHYANAIQGMIIGVFVPFTLGLFFIFQARKTKAKLLFYYGLATFITFFTGLSVPVDFITILITGNNMDGQLFHYLMRTTPPISSILYSYVMAEILIPKKKWYFLYLVLAVNILYLLDLYIFRWTPVITIRPEDQFPPLLPGEDFLQSIHFSPFVNRWWLNMWATAIAFGIGLLYKNIGTKGIIRKKYFFLSAYFIIISVLQIIRPFLMNLFGNIGYWTHGIIYLITYVLVYLGLRAEPEERKKKVKKEIKLKDSLFRIIERPEQITDEEVSYYREQKICLMCKGKVTGFNIFLCPNCEALYHEDCARALTNMENSCWVCDDPIDKTKPAKPFKKVEEKKDDEVKNNKKLIQN
ncbi:MAG: PHD finger domain-containing protein [Candidatus Hodarchaeota archaeon]